MHVLRLGPTSPCQHPGGLHRKSCLTVLWLCLFASYIECGYAEAARGRRRPCTPNITENCEANRFVPCGQSRDVRGHLAVWPGEPATCRAGPGRVRPHEFLLVQFTDGHPDRGGACWEILVAVGECWGSVERGGDYDCQGRCGVGCQKNAYYCSNWSRNCLRHDVCSYFHGSRGGLADQHCGYAFAMASKDFSAPCLTESRCRLDNFSTVEQVCGAFPSSPVLV